MSDTQDQTADQRQTRAPQREQKDDDATVRHLMDNGGWLFFWHLWTIREIARTQGLGGAIMKLALVIVLGLACWEAMNAFGEAWNASLVR